MDGWIEVEKEKELKTKRENIQYKRKEKKIEMMKSKCYGKSREKSPTDTSEKLWFKAQIR